MTECLYLYGKYKPRVDFFICVTVFLGLLGVFDPLTVILELGR